MKQQTVIGTKRQLAAMLNLNERRITDLVTAGIIPARGARGFDLAASVRGYIGFLKTEPGKLVLREAVAKKLFELRRRNRDAMFNIPARLSGILAAESDQDVVFRLLTQELNQAMEALSIDQTSTRR